MERTGRSLLHAALIAHRAAQRGLHWQRLALDAATLGLFSDEALDELTADHYLGSDRFVSDEHNGSDLFTWEEAALQRFFPKTGTLLVTSAGGGREALALVTRGYRVVATDCVEPLAAACQGTLARAVEEGRARVVADKPDAVPAHLGPFDGTIVGWSAYTHLMGRDRRIAFLQRIRAASTPGAPVLLSFWGSETGHSRGTLAVARMANVARALLRRRLVEPGETSAAGFFMRILAKGELPDEARAAGLEVLLETFDDCPHVVARAPT